jgi:hypothetical protein
MVVMNVGMKQAHIGLTLIGSLAVIVIILMFMFMGLSVAGCAKTSRGVSGASDINELVERYKQAHRTKDIEAMRSIHLLYEGKIWYVNVAMGNMGSGEKYMPMLFDLDLVDVEVADVEVVKTPSGHECISLEYLYERQPTRENGGSPIGQHGVALSQPYKLLLLGRRPGEANGPVMEVDACIGVCNRDGRFYIYPASPVLDDAAEWVRTGRKTTYFHPPGHGRANLNPKATLREIPKGWEPIVQPRT